MIQKWQYIDTPKLCIINNTSSNHIHTKLLVTIHTFPKHHLELNNGSMCILQFYDHVQETTCTGVAMKIVHDAGRDEKLIIKLYQT